MTDLVKQLVGALERLSGQCERMRLPGQPMSDAEKNALAALRPQSESKWEGAEEWMPLAWELCAEENGEEACNELIWTGGPIPEPWGDRWLQYEDEAKRLIELVRKHVPSLRPQAVPMTDAPVAYFSYGEDSGYLEHVTAEDASKHAREEITAYRSDAMHDNEWPSEVDSVCWGVVLQKATAVDNSEEAGRESFDYELGPHHGTTQRADGGEVE